MYLLYHKASCHLLISISWQTVIYFDCGLYGKVGDQMLSITDVSCGIGSDMLGMYSLKDTKCQNLKAGINIINNSSITRKVIHRK